MGRKIKFGGPQLPKGRSTWYDHFNPDGAYAGQVVARPGDEVNEDRFGGEVRSDDGALLFKAKGADYYVEAGMASYVDSKDAGATKR